jgi:hypothetical protein
MMATPDNICCPHCGEALGFQITSRLMDSSRLSFAIHPNKGELLSARNVGGAIEQMEKLLVACGKDLGVKTAVLVEGINFNEGSVTVDLLVTRHDTKVRKRAETSPGAADE